MIATYLPERHDLPSTNGDDILRRQSMSMIGNLQFDLLCRLPIRRRSPVLLPSLVKIIRAREPMCGITAVEVLSVVLRETRMRLEDLKGSEVSIEWTWTGTMIEYPGIHTCGTPLEYLRAPILVIANGEFGIARDGQNLLGMIPTTTILNIGRAVPLLTLMGKVGTKIMTIDLGGETRIASGIKADLGQIGTDDLSNVTPSLSPAQQAPGRLERNVKRGNNGNGIQEGDRHTLLRLHLVQIVGMTRERLWLPRFHHRGILPLRSKVVIPLGGIWTHRQSILSHLSRFLLVRTAVSRTMRLGTHRGSDPGVRARCLSPGIPRGRLLRGRGKILLLDLVFRVTIIHPMILGKRTRADPSGVAVITLRRRLRGCLLDPCLRLDPLLGIMDIPLV